MRVIVTKVLSQPGSVRASLSSLLLPRRLRQKDTGGAGPCSGSSRMETGLAGVVGHHQDSRKTTPQLLRAESL